MWKISGHCQSAFHPPLEIGESRNELRIQDGDAVGESLRAHRRMANAKVKIT